MISEVLLKTALAHISTTKLKRYRMGSVIFDMQTVFYGAPHGSVLGPLLFLIFIYDFDNCSTILDFNLFADDANL